MTKKIILEPIKVFSNINYKKCKECKSDKLFTINIDNKTKVQCENENGQEFDCKLLNLSFFTKFDKWASITICTDCSMIQNLK